MVVSLLRIWRTFLKYFEDEKNFEAIDKKQVIAMIGAPTPVVERSRVSDLAAGKSRRASIKTISIIGVSTRTDASSGITLQVCCNKPSAGRTSALAPCELVSSNTLAIV